MSLCWIEAFVLLIHVGIWPSGILAVSNHKNKSSLIEVTEALWKCFINVADKQSNTVCLFTLFQKKRTFSLVKFELRVKTSWICHIISISRSLQYKKDTYAQAALGWPCAATPGWRCTGCWRWRCDCRRGGGGWCLWPAEAPDTAWMSQEHQHKPGRRKITFNAICAKCRSSVC